MNALSMNLDSQHSLVSDAPALTEQEIEQVSGGLGVAAVVVILVITGFAIGAGGAYVASLIAKNNR